MKILSPITHTENIKLYSEINVGEIIEKYSNEYGVDTKRFFNNLEKVSIYECLDTQYRFYFPIQLMGDAKLYEDLQAVQGDYYPKRKWEYEIAERFIKDNDSILDVGCGSGFFLNSQKEKSSNLFGLEFNDEAIKKCIDSNLKVEKKFIEEYALENENKHDVVTSFQVLEHVYDVNSYITNNLKSLKRGGKLVMGVPNSNPYLFKKDKMHTLNLPPHHMGLWNKEAFSNLPKYFDMKLEGIFIEPLYDFEYWFALNYNLWPKSFKFPGVLRLLFYKTFAKMFQGRNIVAVYSKN